MDKVTLLPCPFCDGPAVNVAGEYIMCGAPAFIDCAGRTIRADIAAWNTRATPAPDSEKLREARDFNRGYMLAISNLMHLHGSEVEATDVLGELGASRADMEALDLTDYDLIPLRRLFDEIDRRAALGASA